jgi:hypothetical protein
LYETFVPDGGDRSIPLYFARGYEPKADDSFKEVTSYSVFVAFSSGNMISTSPNMLDWIQAISESSLLSEDSTNQMMDFVSQ